MKIANWSSFLITSQLCSNASEKKKLRYLNYYFWDIISTAPVPIIIAKLENVYTITRAKLSSVKVSLFEVSLNYINLGIR